METTLSLDKEKTFPVSSQEFWNKFKALPTELKGIKNRKTGNHPTKSGASNNPLRLPNTKAGKKTNHSTKQKTKV